MLHIRPTHRRLRAAQCVVFSALLAVWATVSADDRAQAIFAAAKPSILQVLIIEAESEKKSAIGSGFAVDGFLATNFHVVSEALHKPDRYRVEFIDAEGERGRLSLEDFDVVHDLALLREVETSARRELVIATDEVAKGEDVFAVGNPFDLGQTIVPGTFNGLLETSFYQKQLFSGSLNPGMSGGPSLNVAGEVIGVNVATSGNQLSFLVPADKLSALIQRRRQRGEALDRAGYAEEIERQLVADQQFKYDLLLGLDWPIEALGDVRVGGALGDYFKCWGDTQDEDPMLYRITQTSCTSEDSIYISSDLQTGLIDYQYGWVVSEDLGALRFQRMMSELYGNMYTRNMASESDVTNYQCSNEFVADGSEDSQTWRTVMCVRQYKNYPSLYDVLYLGSLVGRDSRALSSHFALSGVTQKNAIAFTQKFMSLQSWDT